MNNFKDPERSLKRRMQAAWANSRPFDPNAYRKAWHRAGETIHQKRLNGRKK